MRQFTEEERQAFAEARQEARQAKAEADTLEIFCEGRGTYDERWVPAEVLAQVYYTGRVKLTGDVPTSGYAKVGPGLPRIQVFERGLSSLEQETVVLKCRADDLWTVDTTDATVLTRLFRCGYECAELRVLGERVIGGVFRTKGITFRSEGA